MNGINTTECTFVDRVGLPVAFDNVFTDEPVLNPGVIFAKAGGGISQYQSVENDFDVQSNSCGNDCETTI